MTGQTLELYLFIYLFVVSLSFIYFPPDPRVVEVNMTALSIFPPLVLLPAHFFDLPFKALHGLSSIRPCPRSAIG